jgi:two-component system sensor histidine kinase DesK
MSAFTVLRRASTGTVPAWLGGRATARSGRAPEGTPAPDDGRAAARPDWEHDDAAMSARSAFLRRFVIFAIITYFLVVQAVVDAWRQPTPSTLFMLVDAIAFTAIVTLVALTPARPGPRAVPWAWLVVIVAPAIALFVVGGNQGAWLIALAVAAAACGRFTATIRPAAFGAITCTAAGLITGVLGHYSTGDMAALLVLPSMAAFFSYNAGKRNEMVATLRQTRAELARVAVAEERLRIARDLHDLLGHSLSLITLKAELSRRMIGTDTDRAAHEMAELEAVARQSLSDVRAAVAGYRQPDLAAELASARQLLTAAGIGCRITAPDIPGLPGDVDAVLAWTIREGITNVVRHARATSVVVTVTRGQDTAVAEITDDGTGGAAAPGGVPAPSTAGPAAAAEVAGAAGLARLRLTGSGLAGLAERIRALGGDLAAGHIQPHGFRLRVTIPVSCRES